jgi:stage II sporulation protein D
MRTVRRGSIRSRTTLLAAIALVGTVTLTTVAAPSARAQTPPSPAAPDAIEVSSGVRFVAPDGALLEVSGIPSARRFLDTVELLPRGSGIDVVNELGFDTYLYGLAEVPQSWPEAVLDAQVIAARSYAWRSILRGTFRDYDICATVACQVFRGAEVLLGSDGDRWRDAVDRTSGQVLMYDGEPILARYFSTSGGRTYANEEVFESSGPRPYLRAIADPYDALSPLHRWEVHFTREEFDTILAEGRTLAAVVPVARVERLGPADDPKAEIRITGENGTSVTVRAIVLRDFLSTRAVALFPDRFPPLRPDGVRPLPSTIPTTRYAFELTDTTVVVHGLGWGHGVGMGQWGAHARALAGHSAEEILAAYYAGLTPVTPSALPARIRAGMGSARLGDAEEVVVRLSTPSLVTSADGRTLSSSLGTWRVSRAGAQLRVLPPVGDGQPLALSATTAFPGVTWGPGATLGSIHPGDSDATDLRITVNKPVQLRLEVARTDGQRLLVRELGVAEAGVHWVRWFHDDADGNRMPAGRYRVRLVGVDQAGVESGEALQGTVLR